MDEHQEFDRAESAFLASEGVVSHARFIDMARSGGRVRVLDSGSGPPVLFVPGVMTGGAVFAGLVGRLSGFRCLMLDRPGTGLSDVSTPPPRDLGAQQQLGDDLIADVLDGLDIDRAHVVSTSMGGWFTFRSLAAHPDRVERVVGLAYQVGARISTIPLSMRLVPPLRMMPRRPRVPTRLMRTLLKSAGMRSAIENGKFSDEMLEWMVALFRWTDTFRNDSTLSPVPASWRGPVDEVRHAPELLASVTAPVHLFWGSDDLFGQEASAREFADLLPSATLEMVDGAGHAPWLDEPERAAYAVRRHLAG